MARPAPINAIRTAIAVQVKPNFKQARARKNVEIIESVSELMEGAIFSDFCPVFPRHRCCESATDGGIVGIVRDCRVR